MFLGRLKLEVGLEEMNIILCLSDIKSGASNTRTQRDHTRKKISIRMLIEGDKDTI